MPQPAGGVSLEPSADPARTFPWSLALFLGALRAVLQERSFHLLILRPLILPRPRVLWTCLSPLWVLLLSQPAPSSFLSALSLCPMSQGSVHQRAWSSVDLHLTFSVSHCFSFWTTHDCVSQHHLLSLDLGFAAVSGLDLTFRVFSSTCVSAFLSVYFSASLCLAVRLSLPLIICFLIRLSLSHSVPFFHVSLSSGLCRGLSRVLLAFIDSHL